MNEKGGAGRGKFSGNKFANKKFTNKNKPNKGGQRGVKSKRKF